ncbi:MAG: helix-turn-helix domain-containing protein [Thermoplasmataceae archaeon]
MKPMELEIHLETDIAQVSDLLKALGRQWALPVIFTIDQNGEATFNTIRKSLKGVSAKSLSLILSDLNNRGLVNRSVTTGSPPHVFYSLSERSQAILPILLEFIEAARLNLPHGEVKIQNYLN